MYDFTKQVLTKVSFDRGLFKKELQKSLRWLKNDEVILLKAWCLTTFVQYTDIIHESFDQMA